MTMLAAFSKQSNLAGMAELDRATFLAFFYLKTAAVEEFTAHDVAGWFAPLGFAAPNKTRLTGRLRASSDTVKGRAEGSFRLHRSFVERLETKFPQLGERSQDVVDQGTVLPAVLYKNTRGYIEKLAAQINVTYEVNAFDGCAVLMRRLTEVLLILAYEYLGIDAEIKDATTGNFMLLEGIVTNAKANTKLALSRNSKAAIETFRQLGNFSAHRITYTCKREYIQQELLTFRALVDELLHKAGILI